MKDETLRALLFLGESQTLEYKEALPPGNIAGAIICAFLNTSGGVLILGTGKSLSKMTCLSYRDRLVAMMGNDISPNAPIFIHDHEIDGHCYLVVEVPEGKDKPYMFESKVYLREGERNITANSQKIKSMILSAYATSTRWERIFSDGISVDDFSKHEISELQSITTRSGQKNIDLMSRLNELSLCRQGRFTNAADILLTKNPAIRHPQTRVRLVAYREKTDNEYLALEKYEGPLLHVLEKTLGFIQKYGPQKIVFSDRSAQRKVLPVIPEGAVREALVNAFVHRDYASFSGGIRIEVSPAKLIIWNSGSLPEGVTTDTLRKGTASVLRNPDIANYFYTRGYMEMLGRGSLLIQQECKNAGLAEPQWMVDDLGVTLTFFTDRPISGPMSGPMSEHTSEPNGSVAGPMSGPMSEELKNEVQQAEEENSKIGGILKVLTIRPMSQSEIASALHLKSVSGALKRALKLLELEFRFIEKAVPDKARSRRQKYQLTALGRQYLEETMP